MPRDGQCIPHTARGYCTSLYQSLLISSDESETGNMNNRFHHSDESRRTLFSTLPSKSDDRAFRRKDGGASSASRPVINVNPFSPFVHRSKSVISPYTRVTELGEQIKTGETTGCIKRNQLALPEGSVYDENRRNGQSLVLNAITQISPFEEIKPQNYTDSISLIRCLESDYIEPFSARRSDESRIDKAIENVHNSQCSPGDSTYSRSLHTGRSEGSARVRSCSMPETMDQVSAMAYSAKKRSQTPTFSTLPTPYMSPIQTASFDEDVNNYISSTLATKLSSLESTLYVHTDDTTYQIFFFTSHSNHPQPIPVHRDVNGMVWLVKSALDGQAYFLKEIECDSFLDAQRILFWEIRCLQVSETCEFITSLHKYWWDPDHKACFLLTECCAGGLAPHYIKRASCIETAVYEVVYGSLQAMKSIHACGLIHGNCHIYNIHINPVMLQSTKAVYSTIKLGNFGSSKSDLSKLHLHPVCLPEELHECMPDESFHSELSYDDVRRFGISLVEFVGEKIVRKFRNPLRRVILRMAGLVDVANTLPPELQVHKFPKCYTLKNNAFSAAELLSELDERKPFCVSYLDRIKLLNMCKSVEFMNSNSPCSFSPSRYSSHEEIIFSPSQQYAERKGETAKTYPISPPSAGVMSNVMDSIDEKIEHFMPNNVKMTQRPTLPILASAVNVYSV